MGSLMGIGHNSSPIPGRIYTELNIYTTEEAIQAWLEQLSQQEQRRTETILARRTHFIAVLGGLQSWKAELRCASMG